MARLFILFVLLSVPSTIAELQATSFVHEVKGFAPFYPDKGARAGMLAINPKKFQDQWARAWYVVDQPSGKYKLTLVSMLEYDGESRYQVLVNNRIVASFQNPPIDGKAAEKLYEHHVAGVELSKGDTLTVAASSQSNRRIPEEGAPGGFGWSRGRWKSVIIAQ